MFMQRVTAKMILAATLSVCLLGMFLTCMTVCDEHIARLLDEGFRHVEELL